MPTENYDNHHDNEEIQQLVERSHYRFISWEGAPGSCWYGALGTRLYAAKRHSATQYLKQNGRLPAGIHLVKVTFGPGADVEREISSKGILTQVVGFGMDELPPMPHLKLGQFIKTGDSKSGSDAGPEPAGKTPANPIPEPLVNDEILAEGMVGGLPTRSFLKGTTGGLDYAVELVTQGYAGIADANEYAVVDENGDFTGEYELPKTINGVEVQCVEGGYVLSYEMTHGIDDEIKLQPGQVKDAEQWLRSQGWWAVPNFEPAWARIVWMLLADDSDVELGDHVLAGQVDGSAFHLFCSGAGELKLRLAAVFTDAESPTTRLFEVGSDADLGAALAELGLSAHEFFEGARINASHSVAHFEAVP